MSTIPLCSPGARRRAPFLLRGLVLLSATMPVRSAEPPLRSNQPIELPAFTVSSQTPDPYRAGDAFSAARIRADLMELPGSISVLTSSFLQDRGPVRLYEATRYLAGVSEGRSSNFQDRQIIRGFESNNVTVDNFGGIQQLNTDEFLVERVEVVKGPSAILAPTGAPGGSINVISKVPSYETRRSLSAIVGWSDAQRVNLDLTGALAPGSPWAYRLLGTYQDGYLNREGGHNKRKIISGAVSYKIWNSTMITVRGTYDHRRQYDPITVAIAPTAINGADATLGPGFQWTGSKNGNESWTHRGGSYTVGDFLLTTAVGNHVSMRLAAKAQYNIQDDENLVLAVPSLSNRYDPHTGVQTPDFTWALNNVTYVATPTPYYDPTRLARTPNATKQWTQNYGFQYDVAANYRFGGISSTSVAGIARTNQITYRKVLSGPNLPAFNLFAPVYGATAIFNSVAQFTTSKSGAWQYYLSQRIGLWKDRVFLTAGGVRVEAERYTSDFRAMRYAEQVDAKNLGTYGMLIRPVSAVSIYGNYSENAIPAIANNIPLWQEGKQYEFGTKLSLLKNRLSFTAAHFQIEQTNVVVPNPAFVTDRTAPNSLVSDIKNRGVEFELQGGITKNLSVIASATSLHLRDSLGRPVRAIAGKNYALFLNYRIMEGPLKGWAPFAGVSYVGRRAGEAPSPNFTPLGVPTQVSYFLPPMTLVSTGARYEWSNKLVFILNVDNVFNERYLISTARANINTGDPLNIRLTTTYKF